MRRAVLPLVPALAGLVALAGCSAEPPQDEDPRISVVAVTDVYGDIASTVGGEGVRVTSIISGSLQDPHSYEASAQDQLAVAGADVVIGNGGGYDPFLDRLLGAAGNEDVVVITALEVSGLLEDHDDHDHADDHGDHGDDEHADEHDGHGHIAGVNEHVWYSLGAMDRLAHELAHVLGELDASGAAGYEENAEAFAADLASLAERAHELHEQWEGTAIAITEPVPLYLLSDLGLDNRTPAEFSEAIEEGGDVPPLVLQATLDLLSQGEVALLAYNDQTASRETERLRDAAEAAGIPVVSFAETLPEGADYVSWMADNLTALQTALG